ncbi:MAG: hypothetical protein A2015_09635 [Spirochaetes bacterium GWF1_31_7]|nr:MAG: hypothetical protein A2Y30_04540 [Spirochaetes bacterium GWE1_32_154]OHD47547.1 MAG: hypothetical protein A2015_09635 [Spirochaetes bacterium GWF1_31_7]OHD52037.1 MAG: hypothetical protein A2Y29_17395 [Spirochaetes bacterium GWE2_31_10]HBD93456.1 glycosyltransferase [Spirochaetia bacterium]HBI36236.1 glycosyltransferase [Spirochaetia bacterium]
MDKNSTVSIITVCFNSAKTIEKTIQSVLNQTTKPFEYLIIDGNSKDETLSIIDRYSSQFENKGIRFVVISEKDTGIYNAMNKGIKLSQGELLGIINSDDYYEPDAISSIIEMYTHSQSPDIIHGNINILHPDGSIRNVRTSFTVNDSRSVTEDYSLLKKRMILSHPSCFIKKSSYEHFGLYNENYAIAADYDLIVRYYKAGARFVYVNHIITNMTIGGISHSNKIKVILETLRVQREHHIVSLSSLTRSFYELSIAIVKKIIG